MPTRIHKSLASGRGLEDCDSNTDNRTIQGCAESRGTQAAYLSTPRGLSALDLRRF